MKKKLLACVLLLPACGGQALPPEAAEGTLIYAALNPVDEELTQSVKNSTKPTRTRRS